MPFFLATTFCWAIAGCTREQTIAPDNQVVPVPNDEAVLSALDCYEPMYKVDADRRVIRLRLPSKHLSAQDFAQIGKLSELIAVDLYGVNLTDDDLAQFKELKKLRNAGLGETQITDKGLAHLEKLPSLQWLWLPRATVTQEGVNKLKDARPDMNVYLQ
jgi:hypothetical protein